jgi:hypothetical protein
MTFTPQVQQSLVTKLTQPTTTTTTKTVTPTPYVAPKTTTIPTVIKTPTYTQVGSVKIPTSTSYTAPKTTSIPPSATPSDSFTDKILGLGGTSLSGAGSIAPSSLPSISPYPGSTGGYVPLSVKESTFISQTPSIVYSPKTRIPSPFLQYIIPKSVSTYIFPNIWQFKSDTQYSINIPQGEYGAYDTAKKVTVRQPRMGFYAPGKFGLYDYTTEQYLFGYSSEAQHKIEIAGSVENYESIWKEIEKNPGLGAISGWTGQGLANIDVTYYKLMGENTKAMETMISQVAKTRQLDIKDINPFSEKSAVFSIFKAPSTQMALTFGIGAGIGTVSKIASGSVWVGTHPVISLAGKTAVAAFSSTFIGIQGYDIFKTGQSGDIGKALGKSWLLGTNIASGIAGYQTGLKFEPTMNIATDESGFAIRQKSITSFRGKPIGRYGYAEVLSKEEGAFLASKVPKSLNWQTVESYTSSSKSVSVPSTGFSNDITNADDLSSSWSNEFRIGINKVAPFDKWTMPSDVSNFPKLPGGNEFVYRGLKDTFVFTFTEETQGIHVVKPLTFSIVGQQIGISKFSEALGITNPKVIDFSGISGGSNVMKSAGVFWKRSDIANKQKVIGIFETKDIGSVDNVLLSRGFGSYRLLPKTPLLPQDTGKPWYNEDLRLLYETGFIKSVSAFKEFGGVTTKPGRFGLETTETPELGYFRTKNIIDDKFLEYTKGVSVVQKPPKSGFDMDSFAPSGKQESLLESLEKHPLSIERQIAGMLSGLSLNQYLGQDFKLEGLWKSFVKPRGTRALTSYGEEYISEYWSGIKPSIITGQGSAGIGKIANIGRIDIGLSNIILNNTGYLSKSDLDSSLITGIKTGTHFDTNYRLDRFLSSGQKTNLITTSGLNLGSTNILKPGQGTTNILQPITKTDITTIPKITITPITSITPAPIIPDIPLFGFGDIKRTGRRGWRNLGTGYRYRKWKVPKLSDFFKGW